MRQVNCPKCGKQLGVPNASTDLKVRCRACDHIFIVPYQGLAESPNRGGGIGWPATVGLGIFGIVAAGLLVYVVITLTPQPRDGDSSGDAKVAGSSPIAIVAHQPTEADSVPDDTEDSAAISESPQISPTVAAALEQLRLSAAQPPKAPSVDGATETGPVKEMTPGELFAKASPAVVRVVVRDKYFKTIGMGSGFFVSSDGLLVTNYHVIQGADFATVLLFDGTTLFVDGVGASDEQNDLALLKVNGSELPFLTLSETGVPIVGTKVYAIGNPKGLTNTFSEGVVSGLRESADGRLIIQTTAAISPGSSGGPLLTAVGQVVGVTTSYSSEGQNLNFAIPATKVNQLIANRGELTTLASTGGKRVDKDATRELDKVWEAIHRQDWSRALALLTKLRPTLGNTPSYWNTAGSLHTLMRNLELAIHAYKAAIALDSNSDGSYLDMGKVYVVLGRDTEALDAFKSAIALKPNGSEGYRLMGAVYEDLEQYQLAVAAYKSAIRLNPTDAWAFSDLASAYLGWGKHGKGIEAFEKAISLASELEGSYLYLAQGTALSHQGYYKEAIEVWEQGIAWVQAKGFGLGPDAFHELIRQARRKMGSQ